MCDFLSWKGKVSFGQTLPRRLKKRKVRRHFVVESQVRASWGATVLRPTQNLVRVDGQRGIYADRIAGAFCECRTVRYFEERVAAAAKTVRKIRMGSIG
jgi:hypothetical protein